MSAYECDECGEDLDGGCECDYEREPECCASAHDWTSEGMGGCTENPGVWSLGGTTLKTAEKCVHCGVVRTTILRGSQRNPHETDTRTYSEADDAMVAAWEHRRDLSRRATQIAQADARGTISWRMPRSAAGQMIECSYGWWDGLLVRRSYDQSDRTTAYAWAEVDDPDEYPDDFGGVDDEPDAEWETAAVQP